MNRLFGCSGSAQLLAAILAGQQRSAVAGMSDSGCEDVANYLLIYDLGLEPSQAAKSALLLERMARQVSLWRKIAYINEEEMALLTSDFWKRGLDYTVKRLMQRLALSSVDELYLGQNRFFFNRLLLNAFRSSTKTCVGDAIGFNYSWLYLDGDGSTSATENPGSVRPPTLLRRGHEAWRSVKRRILKTDLVDVAFDSYCLLAPNLFDERVEHFSVPDVEQARRLFADAFVSPGTESELERLQQSLRDHRDILIVLSADWSGRGHVSATNEVAAMAEYINRLGKGRHTLALLKPHPREPMEKVRMLAEFLSSQFENCLVLREPEFSYQPFESFYGHFIAPLRAAKDVTVVGFSSAVIGLELLYEQPCELGFGEDLVKKYFFENRVDRRLLQENDLARAIMSIRGQALLKKGV